MMRLLQQELGLDLGCFYKNYPFRIFDYHDVFTYVSLIARTRCEGLFWITRCGFSASDTYRKEGCNIDIGSLGLRLADQSIPRKAGSAHVHIVKKMIYRGGQHFILNTTITPLMPRLILSRRIQGILCFI